MPAGPGRQHSAHPELVEGWPDSGGGRAANIPFILNWLPDGLTPAGAGFVFTEENARPRRPGCFLIPYPLFPGKN